MNLAMYQNHWVDASFWQKNISRPGKEDIFIHYGGNIVIKCIQEQFDQRQ
ncbi:hypothetical protein V4B17_02485 [Bartonella sp. B23]